MVTSSIFVLHSWRNPDTGKSENVVVLAGGDVQESELLFVNKYNANFTSGWVTGPRMPIKVYGSRIISYQVTLRIGLKLKEKSDTKQ
jgi:hypothetical protein